MANQTKGGGLAQYGSIIGPLLGGVIAVGLVVGVVMTDNVGEQKTKLGSTTQIVQDRLLSQKIDREPPRFPSAGKVTAAFTPEKNGSARIPRAVDELLRLPVSWDIVIDARMDNEFAQLDADGDGEIDPDEFRDSKYGNDSGPRGRFSEWDTDGNGYISEEEFRNPPGDDRERFDALDKNKDGELTTRDGIVREDIEKMDGDQDGKVSLEEFLRFREEGAVKSFNLAAPANLKVVQDPAKMVVRISWDPLAVENLPPDLGYVIERRAPETVERRRREYGQKMLEYDRLREPWEDRLSAWLEKVAVVNEKGEPDPNGTPDPQKRMFGQLVPLAQRDAAFEKWLKASGDNTVPPRKPPEVDEWERVTVEPITETEYEDSSFELNITYRYAVRAVSNSLLGKNVVAEDFQGWKSSPRLIQESHPVLVRNRIAMSRQSGRGGGGKIALSQWVSIPDSEGMPVWYRAEILVAVDVAGEREIGRKFSSSELNDLVLKDAEGKEGSLPSGFSIDFTTGFTLQNSGMGFFLLSHPEHGDFELTSATKEVPAVIPDPVGMDNPAEVRLLAANRGAKLATFEITRWHRAGDKWYRVVLVQRGVSKGAQVGRTVDLSKASSDVRIYNDSGRQEGALAGQSLNLEVGAFEGLEGRIAKVGGKDFDLFATLYVE